VRKAAIKLAVVAAIAHLCAGATVEVTLTSPATVTQRLEVGNVDARERQSTIADLFRAVGCDVTEQKVTGHASNVVCALAGSTNSTIIAGGHFDFVSHGRGIVDDWSGTSLLPSLYEAIRSRPRRHTFQFVAFAEEEKGLVGSNKYVGALSKEDRANIAAFVNLECLGLAPSKVWARRSDPDLTRSLFAVANSVGTEIGIMNVDRFGDDDTHPFLREHIPVVSIHSVTPETMWVLHTERDKLSAIRPDYYYASYKLAAYYLAYLDVREDAQNQTVSAASR
jgi:Zn-dependent M28 family amino/carboxypeptidase